MTIAARRTLNVRAFAHKGIDTARGARLTAVLQQTEQAMDGKDRHGETSEVALQNMLDHASETTPFYRAIGRGASLIDFPVVDKNTLRNHADAMLSSQFDRNQLLTASTSGSTGTPLVVFQDKQKRLHRAAEAIYFGRQAGFNLGTRLYNLKIWSGRNHQSRLTHYLQNTRPIDVLTFRDREISHFVARLQHSRRPTSIIAYSSALEMLARYLDSNPLRTPPKISAVIAQSEALSEDARLALGRHLAANVVARYGTEEVGIIGQQFGSGDEYVINQAGVHVEILSMENDSVAPAGTLGRIVVTDLRNRAMPIVRYDTGDLGVFKIDSFGHIDSSRLAAVEGRALDQIYDANDQRISSFIFYKCIWRYPDVKQFQFVQLAKATYAIRLNVEDGFEAADAMREDFACHLGKGSTISIEYVDEVPVLSSGKRRQVVQQYTPSRSDNY